MLSKPQQLTLTRPAQDLSPANMFPTRDTVHSLDESGSISRYLPKRHYIELNKDMTATLNQDWEIKPSRCFMWQEYLLNRQFSMLKIIVVCSFCRWKCSVATLTSITTGSEKALLDPPTYQRRYHPYTATVFG